MICEICKQNEATLHIKKIVNGKMTSIELCEHCAKKTHKLEFGKSITLNDFLKGLVSFTDEDLKSIKEKTYGELYKKKCSKCGMTYEEITKKGIVGCSLCYKNFNKEITEILRKMYGSTCYEGKLPSQNTKQIKSKSDLRELKNRLRQVIEDEDYDEAAKLRDKIKALEEKNSNN